MPVAEATNAWAAISSTLEDVTTYVGEEVSLTAFLTGGGEIESAVMVAAAVNPEIDLPTLLIAVTALIIAFAFKYIVAYPLAWALGHIPFVGGTLAGWVTDIGNWEQSTVLAMLTWPINMLVSFLNFLYAFFVQLPIALAAGLSLTAQLLHWVTNTQVPYYYNAATSYTGQVFTAVEHDIATAYNEAIGYTQEVYGVVERDIGNAYNQATTYATGIYNAVEQDLHNDFAWTYQEVQAITQVIEVEIPNEFAQVDQQIGHAFTQAEDDMHAAVAEAEQLAEANLGLAIAGVMAVVTGIGGILQKFLDDCGNTMCESNSQNAKNVQNLAGYIGDGLLLAYLAAAIRDPEGTAAVTIPVIQPLATLGGTLVDDLVTQVA